MTTENAFEIEQSDQPAPEAREFHVDSDHAAEWMLRILANNSAEKVRITAQAQEMIEALEADSASWMYRHGAELEHYCREKLTTEGNRRKSVRFLQGTASFRYQGPAVKVKDLDAALTWAKENAPLLVATELVEKLDGDLFRAEAERIRIETGELLPGVEYCETVTSDT
jgi:hypothetical protein